MKFTGGRLRRWEKGKWGALWDWVKSKKNRHTCFFHMDSEQDSEHLPHVQMVCRESDNNEGFLSSSAPVLVVLPSRGKNTKPL